METALQGAGVIEAEYKVPYLAHAPLEPMNAVVQLKDGRLDIWTGTQIPLFVVAMARSGDGASRREHPSACPDFRGQFRRGASKTIMCARRSNWRRRFRDAPIKMTWTREEDMTHDFPRPLGMARMRGAVKDGQVDAYDLSIACPSVTAS